MEENNEKRDEYGFPFPEPVVPMTPTEPEETVAEPTVTAEPVYTAEPAMSEDPAQTSEPMMTDFANHYRIPSENSPVTVNAAPAVSAAKPEYGQDEYILRLEKRSEERTKKPSALGRAIAFILLAILVGVAGGGAYYALDKYWKPSKETNENKQKPEKEEQKPEDEKLAGTTVDLPSTKPIDNGQPVAVTAVDVSQVVDSVMPAVIAINSYADLVQYDFWTGRSSSTEQLIGSGSGIIIGQTADEVQIVTNNHVVAGATKVEIEFCDGSIVEAVIKGTAASSDLAVVAVPFSSMKASTADAIRVARIGDSDSVKVGQMAIAIGNALGYGQSVTVGYISALNRQITIDKVTYTLIQTDAAINPGNSGGALLNQKGEVIAINSAKYSDYAVEGMGFAIPISNVREIIENLSTLERVAEGERGLLGIASAQDINSSYSSMLGMPEGVYVRGVMENSPAEAAGLRAGDIITKFNNDPITKISDIQEMMNYLKVGTEVTVEVSRRQRSGEFETTVITITLGVYEGVGF